MDMGEALSIIVEDDRPFDECGVAGLSSVEGSDLAVQGHNVLTELQHRGQNAAGIAITEGSAIKVKKDTGLVSEALPESTVREFASDAHHGIFHVRYSTVDVGSLKMQKRAAHPVIMTQKGVEVAIAENGHVGNTGELLEEAGHNPDKFITDAEGITRLTLDDMLRGAPLEEAMASVAQRLEGAFTLVGLHGEKIVGLRDGYGFRPLALGSRGNDGWALASESGALGSGQASFVRDVNPGEMVTIIGDNVWSEQAVDGKPERLCLMELIYLARPDTQIKGLEMATFRKELGRSLGSIVTHEADVVFGVPDSGVPAAGGFAKERGLPQVMGFVKNRYVGRTFISSGQLRRSQKVRMKLRPIIDDVAGKRLDVIEDSVVRGTTARAMVHMLREAGATQVHLNVTSPPYKWPCFYGLDTGTRDQLVAAVNEGDNDNEMLRNLNRYLGTDSLNYLPLDLTLSALNRAAKESRIRTGGGLYSRTGESMGKSVCTACFSRDYPTEISEELLQITPRATLL